MLEGRRIIITGIATADSIANATAIRCQELGAEVLVAAFPRDIELAREVAATLPKPPVAVMGVDVTLPEDLEMLAEFVRDQWGEVDGALHAVAFAPRTALSGDFLVAQAGDVELAFRTSAWSYAAFASCVAGVASKRGASVVGLDFDAAGAWPVYNWMGVCKAALESASRYVARDLGPQGVRSNLVAAGPLHTRAAGAIPGFEKLLDAWERDAPIRWDPSDNSPVADAVCFLLSDLARAITGEILHVDGGYHAMA